MELPDFLQEEREEQIMKRMLSKIPADIDKSEGSYIWDALAPVAAEVAQLKIEMGEYLQRGFARTTFGPYLDYRCEEHGLKRREATKAKGQVKFSGSEGTVIPAGIRVSTTADELAGSKAVEFITLREEVISSEGYVLVNVEAAEAGSQGNVIVGVIDFLITPLVGITGVRNEDATSGGSDEEDDERLLARFLSKVQAPGTSGNKADYKNWALEVDGVGDVQVVPLWNGAGTVKVIIIDSRKYPAGEELVQAVAEHIEIVKPIGASISVASATGKEINIRAQVRLASGYSIQKVQDLYTKTIQAYLQELAFADTYVSYARIGSLLLNTPGVIDYSGLVLNGEVNNLPLEAEEVPVLGAVTLEVR